MDTSPPLPPPPCSGSVTPTLVKLLAEIGFLAISQGQLADARIIFTTLRAFRPDQDFPAIGMALIAIAENAPHNAITLLQEQIPRVPDSRNLHAFLGLALLFAGRHDDSRRLLRQHAALPDEPALQALWTAIDRKLQQVTSPASVDWTRFPTHDKMEHNP